MQDLMTGEKSLIDLKQLNPKIINSHIRETKEMMLMYDCGIKEVKTKLEILNNEFQVQKERNPIEYLKSRVKSLESIVMKLHKKGYSLSVENAMRELNDIAGIRVICSFTSDIYRIAEMITNQGDIKVISVKDYLVNPKPSGYKSYHMLVSVPVYLSDRIVDTKVEIQIRTVAMDFWASLEHKIHYKFEGKVPEGIENELIECAKMISDLDAKMLLLNDEVSTSISIGRE